MKIRTLSPEWARLPFGALIDKVSMDTLIALLPTFEKWVEQNIPMYQILNHYGIDKVTAASEQEHVPCLLLAHGTRDKHASAQYFLHDRNTGEVKPAVYCYKCQKRQEPFWFIFNYERDHHGHTLKETLQLLGSEFPQAPPTELILDFDPDEYYQFREDSTVKVDHAKYCAAAVAIRELKTQDTAMYCQALRQFWTQPLLQGAANAPAGPRG